MGVLTLLTDFGTADYYVAAVKGVILAAAPQTTLVDVSHEVPPGDVATAAFLLAAVAPCFPRGTVHLAVVDPGVGSPRRLLAVATAEARFLAPDNGLLTPVFGPGCEIRAVTREDLFRPAPGATFHGRDRFAPIAAWLLCDGDFAALGPVIADPVRLPVFSPQRLADRLVGRVVHVDRYGNMVTDIPAAWLPGRPCRARLGAHSTSQLVSHYEAIPAGDAAMLTGSLGTVELSARGEDLARRWNAQRGDAVVIAWKTGD